ncbi:uncharacterized protein LOC130714820 [Lotus japonicus]|uniref:uncharacterized protein LOC130714820 n=1 Tax=Lotus japonicus TaxID=34305 RepID=UPI00258E1182|nr:uncharacterized protein LOC130714820 [Lotus japonicus]
MSRVTSNPSFFLLFFSFFLLIPLLSTALQDGVEIAAVKQHDQVLPWLRSAAEDAASPAVNSTTLVLAQERTRRKDFFHHFRRYNGGWNITNNNYITSVLSTAIPFLAVAVAWFVIFGVILSVICACYFCCPGEPNGYSKLGYASSLIILILCTVAAIAGCIVLYISQGKFDGTTSNTLDYVVSQAEFTAENLRNVSRYFDSAEQIVIGVGLSPAVENDIDNVKKKISTATDYLSKKTRDNSKMLHRAIDAMRFALIVVAAVMLFVALLGFLFSILGLRCPVYFLVIVGWVLVAGTFLLCGTFLFLHNAIADTCVAMDEWVLNPTAHTALDEILPCVDNATAMETLAQSKNVTHSLVELVDNFISSVTNGNTFPYNQSGPLVPALCNPFNSDYTLRQCAAGELALENATEVWKNYTCDASSSGNCVTQGRITPSMYSQMAAAVNVTYGLYHYGPFLVDLEDCTFVRRTFTEISNNYCPGLQSYTKWIYWGSVAVSVAVMLSLVFWIIHERERRHQIHTKRVMAR